MKRDPFRQSLRKARSIKMFLLCFSDGMPLVLGNQALANAVWSEEWRQRKRGAIRTGR